MQKYKSTPHLESFDRRFPPELPSSPLNRPTFSTFGGGPQIPNNSRPHHKSGLDLRYRDDPNPYKVSNIDELRIQVQDPYKVRAMSSTQLPLSRSPSIAYANSFNQRTPYYVIQDPMDKFSRPNSIYSSNFTSPFVNHSEGEYEVPDPDYEGSEEEPLDDLKPSKLSSKLSEMSEGYGASIISTMTNHSNSNSEETDHGGCSSSICSPSPSESTARTSALPAPRMKISTEERGKIEFALSGRKTSIFVSDTLVNLYYMNKTSGPPRPNSTGSTGSGSSTHSSGHQEEWTLKYTGVLVLLLDSGETKSRDKRKIQIVLAELGSGLALWKDVIDNLTAYRVVEGTVAFHTMYLSTDHTKVIGFAFDDEDSAEAFAKKIDTLTSDFANISLSGSKVSRGKKEKKGRKKFVRPKKSDISQPCCFQHVASLNAADKKRFSSLQNFVSNLTGGSKLINKTNADLSL